MAQATATGTMRSMIFEQPGRPLREAELAIPRPGPGQVLVRVLACAVCRTDLHLLDGEVGIASPPRVLGHQIVGIVEASEPLADEPARTAPAVSAEELAALSAPGARVGVPWLGWTDGECEWCRSGRENLCPNARFTGRDINGGFAQYAVADAHFCLPLPEGYPDEQAAPLLCAGLIGYRSLRLCGPARRVGLYGFGASAHIVAQVCRFQQRSVYAFTRPGDEAGQAFARELGAVWAGGSDEQPPEPLDAAIVFAPVGPLVPVALHALAPGGTVVCAGIHMSDIPGFPYADLWQERSIRSVANLTRRDGVEFLELAPRVPVRTTVTAYPLGEASQALEDLRAGRFTGAAVIVP
jgi:alcohol dehydrogenase, propanol-preferring